MSETVVAHRRRADVVCAPPPSNNNDNDGNDDNENAEAAEAAAEKIDDTKSDDHETQSLLSRSIYTVAQTPGLALQLLTWLASTMCCGGGCATSGGAGGSSLGGKGGIIDLKVHKDNLLKLERHVKDVERETKTMQSQFDRSAEALEQAAKEKRPYSEQVALATTVKHYKTLLERKHKTRARLASARDMMHRFIDQTTDDLRQADISINVSQMTQQMEMLGDRAESVKEALEQVADVAAEHADNDVLTHDAAEPDVLEAMLRHVYSSKNDKRLNVIQDAALTAEADLALKKAVFPRAPRKPIGGAAVEPSSSQNLLALLDE